MIFTLARGRQITKSFWAGAWGAGWNGTGASMALPRAAPLPCSPASVGLWRSPSLSPECQAQCRMSLPAIPP